MTDTENEKLAVATRLFVRLRHNHGRVIDVVWLVQNDFYAREIIRIAHEHLDPEVQRLALKFEAIMNGTTEQSVADAMNTEAQPMEDTQEVASHYIGALR